MPFVSFSSLVTTITSYYLIVSSYHINLECDVSPSLLSKENQTLKHCKLLRKQFFDPVAKYAISNIM